jgi:Carboxypeptidase regulatory-like domain/Ankyrin repeats (3 copies)/Ankyrin repeats (many copies)
MSRRDFIQQLHIASPCSVDWDAMIGNNRVRFCEHCRLSVHHVDSLSRKQLRRLLARSNGRVCVNYTRSQTQPTLPILHKIGRRTSALAAGAFSATLSLSAATVGAQPTSTRPSFAAAVVSASILNKQFSIDGTGKLRGRVFDPAGAVVNGASVTLTDSNTNEPRYTSTSDEGEYLFDGLQPGTYKLKIDSRGFTIQEVTDIVINADDDTRLDQTLSIAPLQGEVTITVENGRFASGGGMVAIVMPSDPLVKAAMEDDLDTLNAALIAKPDPNVRDKDTHATALEYAVRHGNREMLQVLLWAKVDVNAKNEDGQTALMMLSDKVTSEIVWDLINAGAKVNSHDKDGDTALISVAEENNVEALKALLDAGAKVDASNNHGETALMKAAASGLVNNVRALILAGANVNARDKEGKSALMYANDNSEPAAARLLKAHGAIEFVVEEKQ